MSILFIILIAIAAIIVIILIAASFQKDDFIIERETIINKPRQTVFDYVKYLKNSEKYNKWVMADPQMKREYRGTDGTVGFVYAWDSENKQVGKGEQEIKDIVEAQRVDYEIRFVKPFSSVSEVSIITETITPVETRVIWIFKGEKNFMMKLVHMVFNLAKALGNDMQESLANLKRNIEQ